MKKGLLRQTKKEKCACDALNDLTLPKVILEKTANGEKCSKALLKMAVDSIDSAANSIRRSI